MRVASGVFRPERTTCRRHVYKDRYAILCRRLVRERLYDAACFVTSSREPDSVIHQPEDELSFANFTAAIAGRAAYVKTLDAQAGT